MPAKRWTADQWAAAASERNAISLETVEFQATMTARTTQALVCNKCHERKHKKNSSLTNGQGKTIGCSCAAAALSATISNGWANSSKSYRKRPMIDEVFGASGSRVVIVSTEEDLQEDLAKGQKVKLPYVWLTIIDYRLYIYRVNTIFSRPAWKKYIDIISR